MEQFYDIKMYGNLWKKISNSRESDAYLKHFEGLFLSTPTTMEFLRMHKEMDDLKK